MYKISLDKAKNSRKLAKFFGGKALKGSAKQKSWGESIRNTILESNDLTFEQKEKLVVIGGFTQNASFWIDNRNTKSMHFIAENIVSQYIKLNVLENNFINDRSNYVEDIKAHHKNIIECMNDSVFIFKTCITSVQLILDKQSNKKNNKI